MILPVLLVATGVLVAAAWWVIDDALAAQRARQRDAHRSAVALARINLLASASRQALQEEALLQRLGELDFRRMVDRL